MKKICVDVIKLGGSILFDQDGRLNENFCRSFFDILANSISRQIIVIGCGENLHNLVFQLNLTDSPIKDRGDIIGIRRRAADFLEINSLIDKNLRHIARMSNLSIGVTSPAALFVKTSTGNKLAHEIVLFNNDLLDGLINQDVIPMTSGGVVMDTRNLASAISSDTIAAYLAVKYSADRLLLLTDVNGVYTSVNQETVLSSISLKSMGRYHITEGMKDKLRRIKPAVDKNINTLIINGIRSNIVYDTLIKRELRGTEVLP